jgi:peptide-methionine (R)-S-oxide reductase
MFQYMDKVIKSESEWKSELTPEQYQIARKHGTERAFTEGNYNDEKRSGIYKCVGCGLELFDSETKFDSGTGWPSYYKPISNEVVETSRDFKMILPRTEVHCARCEAHLGHVFNDGPAPSGQRYCMNGTVLDFEPTDIDEELVDDEDEAFV